MGQSGGGGGVTRAVCIRDISPAVKVNARQRREKEIGVGDTGTHTMLQSKATLLTAPYGAINGKSGDREGTAREREKKRRHHRGSVRVQKHTGMEEEGSISRPLFFFIIFFSFTRQSRHCDWMSRRLPWGHLAATTLAEVPGPGARRQGRRH